MDKILSMQKMRESAPSGALISTWSLGCSTQSKGCGGGPTEDASCGL